MKMEGLQENYITTFNTLNLDLLASIKNYFEDWVSETQNKIEYFWRLPDLEKYLE